MAGLVERLLERRLMSYQQAFLSGLNWHGATSASGVHVTEDTALGWVPFYAAVSLIADNVAALPLHLLARQSGGGAREAYWHPLYSILHDQPNPRMTAYSFRQLLMTNVLTWGNGYAVIDWRPDGTVAALWPRRPDRMTVSLGSDGMPVGTYVDERGQQEVIPFYRLFHLMGPSSDGITGRSVISLLREAIGRGIAIERFGARFFANDARPGVVLKHPKTLSDIARNRLKDDWEANHQGSQNAWRPAVLEEGMTLETVGVPPEDAQFLQTAQMTSRQMAMAFRIPPHMMGDVTGSTSWGTGIEQQSIGFVTFTLLPWLNLWEQTIRRDLLGPAEQGPLYPKHNVNGLQRGDFKSRMEGYAIGRQWGIYSADDVLAKEDENPQPNGQGKTYLVPLNMTTADKLGQPAPDATGA